jgi:putative membrane-bound dehydrogenase-like protein
MSARPGFRVVLAAAEPLLRSPVAIEFDADCRIYVAEFPEYNQYANPVPGPKGTVRRLEDRDGDGVYEHSSLFAADIPMASALACWDGGVYVGSAPDLLYLKDSDGDGVADIRRVVLTGFGLDKAGEGMLNSFRWGLDNRYHVSSGLDGGEIRELKGPDARAVNVRGQVVLFNPRGETFAATSASRQHGMSLDDWGRTYVCGNSDPFQLVMYDSRYLARNPYLRAPAAAIDIAPQGKFTKLYRKSEIEPWRALRTELRHKGLVPGSDEGGTPAGFFTGATGVTVYRGDAYPPEFEGNLFVGDVANNLIHRARAMEQGLTVSAQDAEPNREFVASADSYFRPVQMANGPDGCLWVVDMYRELIEGAAFLPPEILNRMDVASGIDRGRIWRIVPDGSSKPRLPKLSKATTAELVALLEHKNGWHRDTASRLLYERQDRTAADAIRQLARTSSRPIGRAQALGVLEGLGVLGPEDLLIALNDQSAKLREFAIKLAEPFVAGNAPIAARMKAMVADPDPRVRYQLAFSLASLPGDDRVEALVALARNEAVEPWTQVAILSSAVGCAGELFSRLVADSAFRSSAAGRALLVALVDQTDAPEQKGAVLGIIKSLDGPLASEPEQARQVALALMSRDSRRLQSWIGGTVGSTVRKRLLEAVAEARTCVADDARPVAERVLAVKTLKFGPWDDVAPLLTGLLEPRQPQTLIRAAIDTLSQFDDPRVPTILLEAWKRMSPRIRASATEALFSRPAWLLAFLDAVDHGLVGRSDLDLSRLALLKTYPDPTIRGRATKLLEAGQPRRADVVAAYKKALRLKGDAGRGRLVFRSQCSTCHRLEGVGQQVGADLSAVRDRGLEAVLLNILDPNREVMPQYLSYVVATTEGRVVTGMIAAETVSSLTIRQPDGHEETILRLNVDELSGTGQSFMPEGLEKAIDITAMADLLAYLNTAK